MGWASTSCMGERKAVLWVNGEQRWGCREAAPVHKKHKRSMAAAVEAGWQCGRVEPWDPRLGEAGRRPSAQGDVAILFNTTMR